MVLRGGGFHIVLLEKYGSTPIAQGDLRGCEVLQRLTVTKRD